jgi:hypothetical protein
MREHDRLEEWRPGAMHGWAYEPGQALIGAALSIVCPVPSMSWPSFHKAIFFPLSMQSGPVLMSYTVLARRYRSGSFEQVVGQEAIANTLRNAIERGRVAHAYLFTGTRGVGKTSMMSRTAWPPPSCVATT